MVDVKELQPGVPKRLGSEHFTEYLVEGLPEEEGITERIRLKVQLLKEGIGRKPLTIKQAALDEQLEEAGDQKSLLSVESEEEKPTNTDLLLKRYSERTSDLQEGHESLPSSSIDNILRRLYEKQMPPININLRRVISGLFHDPVYRDNPQKVSDALAVLVDQIGIYDHITTAEDFIDACRMSGIKMDVIKTKYANMFGAETRFPLPDAPELKKTADLTDDDKAQHAVYTGKLQNISVPELAKLIVVFEDAVKDPNYARTAETYGQKLNERYKNRFFQKNPEETPEQAQEREAAADKVFWSKVTSYNMNVLPAFANRLQGIETPKFTLLSDLIDFLHTQSVKNTPIRETSLGDEGTNNNGVLSPEQAQANTNALQETTSILTNLQLMVDGKEFTLDSLVHGLVTQPQLEAALRERGDTDEQYGRINELWDQSGALLSPDTIDADPQMNALQIFHTSLQKVYLEKHS